MSRRLRPAADPTLIAIIEPAGGELRVGFWRLTGAGVRLEREVRTTANGLPSLLDSAGAARSVVLLAPGQVRCRFCELPNAAEAQLDLALRLQAESMQLGSMPRHRVAIAVLPGTAGGPRSGVILEWPTTEPPVPLPASLVAGRGITFAADVSALAAMASSPGVEGPLLVLDSDRGMVSFAVRTPRGVVVRSAREELHDPELTAVVHLVVETAMHHGMDAAALDALAGRLREALAAAGRSGFGSSGADRRALASSTGAPADADWWRAHGVQAGIALAAAGPLASLVELRAHEPGEEPDALGRIVNRLEHPRTLAAVVAAALGVVILGPLAIAFVDYQIMRWKVAAVGSDEFRGIVAANDRLLAIYQERSIRTWPMTKLLADLACCTPEGIDFEQIQIAHDESVTVRGKARRTESLSGPEVILKMERLMQQSGIFDRITKGWDPPNQLGEAQFTLSASVTRPTLPMKLTDEQDWGKLTLAERKWGPAARPENRRGDPMSSVSSPSISPADTASEAVGDRTGETVAPNPRSGSGVAASSLPLPREAGSVPSGGAEAAMPQDEGVIAHANGGDAAPAETEESRRGTTGARRANERNLATVSAPPNERAGSRAGPATIEPDKPPPPISDEEIAAMTKEEALAAASIVAKARNNRAFDEATIERLKGEFTKLMAHVRSFTE